MKIQMQDGDGEWFNVEASWGFKDDGPVADETTIKAASGDDVVGELMGYPIKVNPNFAAEYLAGFEPSETVIEFDTVEWFLSPMPGTVPPIWVPSKLWPFYQGSEN